MSDSKTFFERINWQTYKNDTTEPGERLFIERRVLLDVKKCSIDEQVGLGEEELEKRLKQSEAREGIAYRRALAAASNWEAAAAETQRLQNALVYLKTPAAEHTGNQWVYLGNKYCDWWQRSNATYRMSCWFNKINSQWRVEWNVSVKSPREDYSLKSLGGKMKSFVYKEDAEKYLRGRVKAYEGLFAELYPPVPKEFAEEFSVGGKLLPGYRVEETVRVERGKAK